MRAILLSLALLTGPASAHEFWLEPDVYQVPSDGKLVASLVNGELFEGTEFSYLPQRFERFEARVGAQVAPVENRLGARPPLDMAPLGDGLHVVTYVSTPSQLTYDDFAKFQRFADHKDFPDIEARHAANGFPPEGFAESYTRFAKTLIATEGGAGSDVETGMEVELIALDNPYTDDLSGGLRVLALYQGNPRADAQIELFEKAADGTVTVSLYRTDAEGVATLPVRPGYSYLADAVVLREAMGPAAANGAVWETLWAALTFAVPAD